MKLCLAEILKCDGAVMPFSGEVEGGKQEFVGNLFTFPHPMKVTGTVTNQRTCLKLEATATGEVESDCARCGKPVTVPMVAEISEILTQEGPDDEMIYFTGDTISLDEIVMNGCILSLPEKFLCSADCKGLCPVCGKDRNEGACSCEQDEGDPRLEIFRKLAKKDEV